MFAAIPGLAFLAAQPVEREIIGPMTIDRERMLASRGVKVTILHRGQDVTNRCQFADDTPGRELARLLKHNADGRPYVDQVTREVVREVVTGDVRIVLGRKA
jgi:hypothetical protein